MKKTFYRFDPVGDREGNPSRYHKKFEDEKDFNINTTLLKQINFASCHETTPEGKALWLYIRLCQLMKYDEGYFYSMNRNHPNDDPYKSFEIVDQVTAETPTTCFNFSRIAVKLLNQIPGVNALMIAVGGNCGHFRFGYYTDRVSVDAEPTSPNQHFNDLARAKLGIRPQGLRVFEGQEMMSELMQRLSNQMLMTTRRGLRDYVSCLQQLQQDIPNEPQIELEPLISILKKYGVDGNSIVQFLISLNHQYAQNPYDLMRAGMYNEKNKIQPQLLVREKAVLKRIDLTQMRVFGMTADEYSQYFYYGDMIYSDGGEDRYFQFSSDLHASQRMYKNNHQNDQVQISNDNTTEQGK